MSYVGRSFGGFDGGGLVVQNKKRPGTKIDRGGRDGNDERDCFDGLIRRAAWLLLLRGQPYLAERLLQIQTEARQALQRADAGDVSSG